MNDADYADLHMIIEQDHKGHTNELAKYGEIVAHCKLVNNVLRCELVDMECPPYFAACDVLMTRWETGYWSAGVVTIARKNGWWQSPTPRSQKQARKDCTEILQIFECCKLEDYWEVYRPLQALIDKFGYGSIRYVLSLNPDLPLINKEVSN